MTKTFIILLAGLASSIAGYAQEFKVAKSTGRLLIMEVNNVSIEGHSGNEIIFISKNFTGEKDDRAKGLRAISSLGLEDNSGLGLSFIEKGEMIEVRQLKKTEGPEITIRLPKGVAVSYVHSSPYGKEVEIKNFPGEIAITSVHSGVVLTNTTGKTSVKTVHGNIEAALANPLSGPVSLESVHGHVDVALPAATKASLTLGANWGEVLIDPDFKIELERSGELVNYGSKIRGKINGGGTEMVFTSDHDNVYLRKAATAR